MKEETQEWIDSAEEDWEAVNRLMDDARMLIPKVICFHAQQTAEMYLKARLTEAVIYFPKTHDLRELLDLVLPVEPDWDTFRPKLSILTRYAIITRYPGYALTRQNTEDAYQFGEEVRAAVRLSLGLSE